MKEINLIPQEFIRKEKVIDELGELAKGIDLYNEDDMFETQIYLNEIKKELDIVQKLYDKKIREITGERSNSYDRFNIEFKSSKLFDKDKAHKYIFDKGMQDEFMVQELDYKKVQLYIKSMENYDNFTKSGAKKLIVKRNIK